jgi:hypothetical protein
MARASSAKRGGMCSRPCVSSSANNEGLPGASGSPSVLLTGEMYLILRDLTSSSTITFNRRPG